MAAYTDSTYYKSYFNSRGTDVSGQLDVDIDAALLVATEYLDDTYSFTGYRVVETQEQAWPRSSVYTKEGILVSSDSVPAKVKDAACELAYIELTQTGGIQPLFDGQVIKRSKKRVSTLEKDIEYDSSASAAYERYYAKAFKKIQDFVIGSPNSAYIQRVI